MFKPGTHLIGIGQFNKKAKFFYIGLDQHEKHVLQRHYPKDDKFKNYSIPFTVGDKHIQDYEEYKEPVVHERWLIWWCYDISRPETYSAYASREENPSWLESVVLLKKEKITYIKN